MSQQIDTIYDQGVFKPLVPPGLPDQTRDKLTVDTEIRTSADPQATDFDGRVPPAPPVQIVEPL